MTPYLAHAMHDARAIELRHLDGERIACGVFTDPDCLRQEIGSRAGRGNLYITLNRPRSSVRADNAMRRSGLHDTDIERIVRLPFDFDPVRPKGSSSTADELAAAVAQRDRFVAAQHALGWPMPALAVSGNGAHAVYRCLLPNGDRTRQALRTIYTALKREFSTDEVLFDSTVHNPSRIWRLYGTMNRKGTPTPERPHRVARIVMPHKWLAVAPDQVYRLAEFYARSRERPAPGDRGQHATVSGAGDYRTLDAVAWFGAHSAYRRELGSGKHAVKCPWDSEHSTVDPEHSTAAVIWAADGGWPTFHCSHAHCEGRSISDVMALWGDADRFCAREFRRAAA